MSTNRVRQITPYQELKSFLEYLYGDRDGYVYAPSKVPGTKEWFVDFFRWPLQKKELIRHYLRSDGGRDLYISPALWSSNRISRDTFLGVSVVWAELDYGIPSGTRPGVPEPTVRIRSSTDDHQHWYWKLNYWEDDPEAVEKITKRLAYAVDADLSCWDYQQVLRPPNTQHLESGLKVTQLLRTDTEYGLDAFIGLPEPPQGPSFEDDLGEVPDTMAVIAKYQWKDSSFEIFRQNRAATNKRSDTLCFLAYECAEMGMSDTEILSVLLNADDRWDKFKGRTDRVKRLRAIILRARYKYPVKVAEEVEDDYPVFGFVSFLEKPELQTKWIVPDLIAQNTVNMISALPGIGKSQISMRLGMSMALAEDFLKWPIPESKRIMFVSMDMANTELMLFSQSMRGSFTDEQLRILEKNFIVLPIGEAVPLDKIGNQAKVTRLVEKYTPDLIMFDTFGNLVGENINSKETVDEVIEYFKSKLIKPFDTTIWLIHHNRKPQIGNKKPVDLTDVFGSQYIGGSISAGIGLWQTANKPYIEVRRLKSRLTEAWPDFNIERTPNLGFQLYTGAVDPTKPKGKDSGSQGSTKGLTM